MATTQNITDLARWKTIAQGQCAFRSSNIKTQNLRCKHLFTNTSECHFVGCPIVQSNYVALQRSFDDIYLVTKDSTAEKISDVWKDVELPAEKDEAIKVVTEATKNLNDVLKDAVTKKFEHLYSVATTVRESSEDESLSDDDDLDLEE